ncbi:hypothetical protein [Nannocystis punicea]|uniref:Tetratricopeptide repeat protein n=1 Tax=Nannocystis punicea TaxID=2995304 RepID=A0ABY7GSZ2_9BACT|nr:hypothetical protein [Nannocystis poenicansa]WAS90072.1 hypothetical protein O0S08_28085 [Nannocystis poenicansa]
MKRAAHVYAERFAVERDPASAAQQQEAARWEIGPFDRGSVPEASLWLHGVEIETKQRVWIALRGHPVGWVANVETEVRARAVMASRSPFIVPVLHAGPGIVYAEPPPARPRPQLRAADAAACAVQACEVVAQMHALGEAAPYFGPSHLRLSERDGVWRIAWLLPGQWALDSLDRQLAERARNPTGKKRPAPRRTEDSPITVARRAVVELFAELLGPHERAGRDELERIRRKATECADMPALARLFLPLVAEPVECAARIEAMPVVRTVPKRERDWDAIIRDGEATLPSISRKNAAYVALPLACAYHQRATRRAAAGEPALALEDVERALKLDPCVTYAATRAVLRDRLGQRAAARAGLATATVAARATFAAGGVVRDNNGVIVGTAERVAPADLAHALEVGGLLALHDDEPVEAMDALLEAFTLAPTAARAHALGAALFRCGHVAAAADYEARSVALAPDEPRYVWALVGSLLRLGRAEEAREQALALLRRSPDDAAQREKFARVFGA